MRGLLPSYAPRKLQLPQDVMFIVKLGLFVEFTLSDLRPLSYIFQWTARRHEQSSGQGQAYGSARLDTVL